MSDRETGPARRTRSRINSDKSTSATKSKENTPKEKSPERVNKQRSVSSYFKGSSKKLEITDSPKSSLKKRSASGNIYKSIFIMDKYKNHNAKENEGMEGITEIPRHTIDYATFKACHVDTPSMTTVTMATTTISNTMVSVNSASQIIPAMTTGLQGSNINSMNSVNAIERRDQTSQLVLSPRSNTSNPLSQSMGNQYKLLPPTQMPPLVMDPRMFQFSAPIQLNTPQIAQASNFPQDPMYEILRSMNEKLNVIQTDVKSLKDSKVEITEQIAGMQYCLEEDEEHINSQNEDLIICKDKIESLSNIVIRNQQLINDMSQKMSRMEANNMNTEMVLSGIVEVQGKSCKELAQQFIREKLQITDPINIIGAYWKGQGNNKPMVIKLEKAADKFKLYAQTSLLKGVTNENKRNFRLSDHLPEQLSEEQSRQRQIVAANKNVQESYQHNIVYKKGKLMTPHISRW